MYGLQSIFNIYIFPTRRSNPQNVNEAILCLGGVGEGVGVSRGLMTQDMNGLQS